MPDSLPRTGEIVGRRPFINVGLGTDRLGGAKLGYVEPGGRVSITGKVGRQYRIRLSEQLTAWIPAEYVRVLPADTPPPTSLTGSISVTGTDTEDVVSIGLSQRLPYRIDQVSDPTAVLLDVYGATSNTNWITHNLSAKGIKSVSWDQVASDQYRLVIELNHEQHWGTSVSYSGTGISVRLRRPPLINPDQPLEGLMIALDAGHGGDARGALGATGAEEKNMTMLIVQQLDSVIQARGGATVLTRNGDDGPGMTDRAEKVVRSGAHILVSVHCNSTGLTADPVTVSGTAMFYRYLGFKPLADRVFAEMMKTGLKEFGVVGSFNFSLNGPTELPNILVETAFMSNPDDEMFLLTPQKRTEVAVRVADGVENFIRTFGLVPQE
jgi:N-acetylmuramoyl-L-alanine amidase